jgi:hypothetical protein
VVLLHAGHLSYGDPMTLDGVDETTLLIEAKRANDAAGSCRPI